MDTAGRQDLGPVNQQIGAACRSQDAACCKQGKIFLPEGQYRTIIRWIALSGGDTPFDRAAALTEFEERCDHRDGYVLYNQQDRCQFLGEDNRCGLYGTGARPLECLWWPLHVYAGDGGQLEIRSASWCCTAAAAATQDVHVDLVAEDAEITGHDLIRRYRAVYPGRPGPLLRILDTAT
jgi:Fe-S-cluster containining protein